MFQIFDRARGLAEAVAQEGALLDVFRRAGIDHQHKIHQGQSLAEIARGEVNRLEIVQDSREYLAAADGEQELRAQHHLARINFVEPALATLPARGTNVRFGTRLRAIAFGERRAEALDFGSETLALGPGEGLVLAVPAWVASALVPGINVPSAFRAIVNAHFRLAPPPSLPPITGVVNASTEWIFGFPDRLAVTISGADRLLDVEREELAQTIWREVAEIAGIAAPLPPWQIIKERRATFAATPEQNAKRPGAETRWHNLALAGDWTATGLPATIEGAIRSGNRAAEVIARLP